MHIVQIENAERFIDWLENRGGIAIWRSIDLSDPGASCFTPAQTDGKPTTKPHWKYANEPEEIVTDINQFEVVTPKEVKRFHVAIRRGLQGFTFKLTDTSTARVRKAVDKAGEGAWYEFDYGEQNAIIYVPGEKKPLSDFI